MNDRERRSSDGNGRRTGFPKLAAAVIITAALTFGIAALLVTMIERKTEAKNRYLGNELAHAIRSVPADRGCHQHAVRRIGSDARAAAGPRSLAQAAL